MKILAATIFFLSVLFFWGVDNGYQYFSFVRHFGVEQYSADQTKKLPTSVSKIISHVFVPAGGEIEGFSTPTPRIVTHIKTPEHVKAIYMSSWVAGSPSFREKLVKQIDTTELNAVVIDVKDNTGVMTWDSRAPDLDSFIDELHNKNIYVIGRIAAFQDPVYINAHPDEAVHSKATGGIWKDDKGISWVDTGSKNMWDYLIAIGEEAYERGFDELNYDYIRFPTDGKLGDMTFPISGDRAKTDKLGIVSDFYVYLNNALHAKGIPTSADIFGIVLVTKVDIPTLGQDLHVALKTFDFVSPMVYPSHFYTGTAGFQNPAAHPGEIITFAMSKGVEIAKEVASSTGRTATSTIAQLRPFYQDFDMGAIYTKEFVRAQIDAGNKLGIESWMLWDPGNTYTTNALLPQ